MRTSWKRTTILAALVCVLLLTPMLAHAESERGSITGNQVNLRGGPGLNYPRLAYLYRGDAVTLTGSSNGWYEVTYGSLSGYVYGDYVRVASEGSSETGSDAGGSTTGGTSGSGTSASSGSLKRGSTGDAVKQLQGNLIMLGYLNSRADGIFGSGTEAAVKRYQSRNGLSADGVAGKVTTGAVGREVLRVLAVVDTAKKYLGLAYTYGGTSPSTGFDCSGLTQYAFDKAGISIPRVSYEQAAAGISVPRAQLRIGDLVAFNSPVSHVGIYVGNGMFIHSPKTGDVVKTTKLSAMNLTAIRRFTGVLAG